MTTEIWTETETRGLIDAADRILRQLINTPKHKEAVITLLNAIDPPAARRLVRTIFWQDPGLFLSLLGSLPAMVNTGSEALAEAAAQMNSMPPALLKDILNRIVAGIDGEVAGEAAGRLISVLLSLGLEDEESDLRQRFAALGEDFARAYGRASGGVALSSRLDNWMAGVAARAGDEGSATHAFIQQAGKALENNPDFVKHVLKPLLEPALQAPAAEKKPAKPKAAAKKTAKKPSRKE